MKSNYKLHIDFLRILAIFLVLLNHTEKNGFFLYCTVPAGLEQWIYVVISSVVRMDVPIFFMISGALLLGREESLADLFRKRILKFGIVLLLISVFYAVYHYITLDIRYSPVEFIYAIYTRPMAIHLWYLYAYMGILLMLPVLRRFVISMRKCDYIYLAAMSVVFTGLVPYMDFVLFKGTNGMNSNLKGAVFTAASVVYFMMGYFIENVVEQKYFNKKTLVLCGIGGGISVLLCSAMTLYRGYVAGNPEQDPDGAMIPLAVYFTYMGAKMLFSKIKVAPLAQKLIATAGSASFGIYLFEVVFRNNTYFVFELLKPVIGTMPACLIWVSAALIWGTVIITLVKKIPMANKLI